MYVAESSHLSENSRPESCSLPSEGQGLVENSSTQGLQELLNGTDNGESNILQEDEQNQSVLGNNTVSQVILNGSESPSGDEQVDSDKSVVMPESEHDHSKNESSNETDSLRRSARTCKPPAWFQDYAMSRSQRVSFFDWQARVRILVSLVGLFPDQQEQICNAILIVIVG